MVGATIRLAFLDCLFIRSETDVTTLLGGATSTTQYDVGHTRRSP